MDFTAPFPPLLATMHQVDYLILAGYMILTLGVGYWCSHSQHTTKDYFLASRSMHWFPVGLSLVVTLFSALSFTGYPAKAFQVGLLLLVMTLLAWLETPVVTRFVIPFYYNLGIYTAYEYLERRFDLSVRVVSSLLFVLWRSLWLGAVLYAPCKVLLFTMGFNEQANPNMLYGLIITLGVITTVYTFLGGMKAVILTDAMQFVIIVGAIWLVVGTCLFGPQGVGLTDAWQTAKENGLTQLVKTEWSWTDDMLLWVVIPHFFLANLSFHAADQITLQRFLTTPSLSTSKRSMWTGTVARTIMLPMLIVLGIALNVFYHNHPDRHHGLLEQIGNEQVQKDLADGEIDPSYLQDDRALANVEYDLIMPHFITTELPVGFAGIIVAALFAAAMSSVDSGLNSVSTSMIVDFHRRLGIGRRWLASYVGKSVDELTEADELILARPLCVLLGVWATALGIAVSHRRDIFDISISIVNTFGGPLLAVVLVAMFSRRVGPRGVLLAMFLGIAGMVAVTVAPKWIYAQLESIFPGYKFGWSSFWNLPVTVVATMVLASVFSRLLDAPPPRDKLQGLVVGVGEPGATVDRTGDT